MINRFALIIAIILLAGCADIQHQPRCSRSTTTAYPKQQDRNPRIAGRMASGLISRKLSPNWKLSPETLRADGAWEIAINSAIALAYIESGDVQNFKMASIPCARCSTLVTLDSICSCRGRRHTPGKSLRHEMINSMQFQVSGSSRQTNTRTGTNGATNPQKINVFFSYFGAAEIPARLLPKNKQPEQYLVAIRLTINSGDKPCKINHHCKLYMHQLNQQNRKFKGYCIGGALN